jgi:hypothetical protein
LPRRYRELHGLAAKPCRNFGSNGWRGLAQGSGDGPANWMPRSARGPPAIWRR